MDRRYFIPPYFVAGTTVEGKVIALLNRFSSAEDFDVIEDRPGLGYAKDRVGYGIDRPTAQRILDARPEGGWTSLSQVVGETIYSHTKIDEFGPDKFSDLVVSAIALSGGSDHLTIRGSFRLIDPADDSLEPPNITDPIDVIVYGKFAGSAVDYVIPIQLVETDENGEFLIEHITNDYEQFALVAAFRDSEEVFHRSGLISVRSYPLDELEYRPILIKRDFSLTDEEFRKKVKKRTGTVVNGDKTLERITSDFKDGFVEIKGEVNAPDTFLWFDSTVTFTSHVHYLSSRYAPNWVRDLSEILGVQSHVVKQNHSNVGFVVTSILSFLIPPSGLALGPIVSFVFMAVDARQDASVSTRASIAYSLRESFSDQALEMFRTTIQAQIDNAPPKTKAGLLLLSEFDEDDPPEDPLQAIIDYMASHVTVESVTIDPEEMRLKLWLTLPFVI